MNTRMKLVLLGLSVWVYGCSDQSGDSSVIDETQVDSILTTKNSTISGNTTTSEKTESFSVMAYTYADLPECDDARDKALSYVKSEKAFYVCEYGSWDIIDMGIEKEEKAQQLVVIEDELAGYNCKNGGKVIHVGFDNNNDGKLRSYEYESSNYVCNGINGEDGQDGINGKDGQDGINGVAIEGIYQISQSYTNYCTYYDDEWCYFEGGQVVKYTDGSKFITLKWRYALVGTGNYDSDIANITYYIPADWTGAEIFITSLVARTSSSYRSVYFKYNSKYNSGKVILDADDDKELDFTDPTLFTPTITEL